MIKWIQLLCLLFIGANCLSQDKYVYSVDLAHIVEDRVSVILTTPKIKEPEVTFSFPRVIPGSYSEKSFGKYIDDFVAKDKDGNSLKLKRLNKNQFLIKDATKLTSISYKVNDTWDNAEKDFVFQPGGSNIEAGSNVIMNNHAFFGYFEGYQEVPIELRVDRPSEFYASTHLPIDRNKDGVDILQAQNYAYLADNPIFYCKPDTSTFFIGKTRINVSVFSATGKVKSGLLVEWLKPMAIALESFFKGLPVDSYQFLFYFEDSEKALTDKEKGGGGYGALEHNYSSLYFLPEMAYEPRLKEMVNGVTSHEFLHILTPLNLHSEQIEHFNFIEPKMSKHLWLYEGVTEYFSNLVQLQNGLMTEKAFFKEMRDKVNQSGEYGSFAMTEMSERVLEEKYKSKYGSVYDRGALIGLLLDIHIREKTNNEKDLKSVVLDLSKKYGAGKPFIDDAFLDEFAGASHASVKDFIDKYISGSEELPFADYFEKLGYEFAKKRKTNVFFNGGSGLKYDEENKAFLFADVSQDNALGIKEEDRLVSVDGIKVTDENIDDIWENYFQMNTDKPQITVKVLRGGEEVTLNNPLKKGYVESKNFLAPASNPSPAQKALLERLMFGRLLKE